jgi:hypothetical protein
MLHTAPSTLAGPEGTLGPTHPFKHTCHAQPTLGPRPMRRSMPASATTAAMHPRNTPQPCIPCHAVPCHVPTMPRTPSSAPPTPPHQPTQRLHAEGSTALLPAESPRDSARCCSALTPQPSALQHHWPHQCPVPLPSQHHTGLLLPGQEERPLPCTNATTSAATSACQACSCLISSTTVRAVPTRPVYLSLAMMNRLPLLV